MTFLTHCQRESISLAMVLGTFAITLGFEENYEHVFVIFHMLLQCYAGIGREREKINLLDVYFERKINFLSA